MALHRMQLRPCGLNSEQELPNLKSRFGRNREIMKEFNTHLGRMADGVGFEPTVSCPTAVFKTAALNHSATHPVPHA